MKKIMFLFLFLIICQACYGFCPPGGGDPRFNTISGVVKRSSGEPMPKVKVRIQGSNKFYITDENGFFIFSNVDRENITLAFESNPSMMIELGNIGMQKVVYIEDIILSDGIAKAKTIHTKNSYDLSGMSPEDLAVFQFSNASLEDQVKAFLGIRRRQ